MVKYCTKCLHSRPESNTEWLNRCIHPEVIKKNSGALANNCDSDKNWTCGVSCKDERNKSWFAACGKRGKLYEVLPTSTPTEKLDNIKLIAFSGDPNTKKTLTHIKDLILER